MKLSATTKKNIFKFFLLALLLTDLVFSFVQHFHTSLDGDMSRIILGYHEVMSDPFGLGVLLHNKIYAAPNRFFAHFTMSWYFKNIPFLLQHFVSPVQSIYLSCALLKTTLQFFIIWLLALFVCGKKNFFSSGFLLAMVLITPLFQTSGYHIYMGIISRSITYTFFYAFPLCFLLFFFAIFYFKLFENKNHEPGILQHLILFTLTIALPLSGPLIPAVIVTGCPIILLYYLRTYIKKNAALTFYNVSLFYKNFSKITLTYFFVIWILSLYSLFIGRNNSENLWHQLPLIERFLLIPKGLYYPLTQKLGLPLLVLMIGVNLFIISKQNQPELLKTKGKLILQQFKWIGMFIILYILLLPLGGYREYRPNILRSDTLMPVTLCAIFIFARSAYYLLNQKLLKFRKLYAGAVIIFLLIFTWADKGNFNENECEKSALENISESNEKIVVLENSCMVMAWRKITDYNESVLNGEMLYYWGITQDEKRYYQK